MKRPIEGRACDAGMDDDQCVKKNVVYCMSCTICDALYVGETKRPVRERFAEHYRNAKKMDVRTPWGKHVYHPDVTWKPLKYEGDDLR